MFNRLIHLQNINTMKIKFVISRRWYSCRQTYPTINSGHLIKTRTSTLQSSGTRDNFNKLSSNDGLSGSVKGDGEFVNHFTGVLAGVVHGSHSGALLAASSLLNKYKPQFFYVRVNYCFSKRVNRFVH